MAAARIVGLIVVNVLWAVLVLRRADRRFAAEPLPAGAPVRGSFLEGEPKETWDRLLVGLFAPAMALGCSFAFDSGWVAAMVSTYLVFCAVVAVRDLRWRIIPNALVYPAFPLYAGAVVALWAGGQGVRPFVSLFGMLAYGGGLFLLALLWQGAMGIGDVKLAGLTGLVLGALGWAYVAVAAAGAVLLGGIVGVVVLIAGGRRTKIPFGPYLALGAVLSGFVAPEVARWYLGRLG